MADRVFLSDRVIPPGTLGALAHDMRAIHVVICAAITACAHAGEGNAPDASGACQNGEARSCYPGAGSEVGVGACRAGTELCVDGAWGACTGAQTAVAEVCGDNVDNDCNGDINNGCACTYALTTGQTFNGNMVCCAGASTLAMVSDCGNGNNHSAQPSGNCGVALEGGGNNGTACVAITCNGTLSAGSCK
jgi:hypothetical protein